MQTAICTGSLWISWNGVCLRNCDPSKCSRVKENLRDLHLILVYLRHAAKTRRIINSAFVFMSLTYTAPSLARIPLGFLPLLAAEYTSITKNSKGVLLICRTPFEFLVLQIRQSCRRERKTSRSNGTFTRLSGIEPVRERWCS